MWVWMILTADLLILTSGILLIFLIFQRRENRLMNSLMSMLEDAINGSFQADRLDESKFSALENSMKRYLADCGVSKENLKVQKQTIQTMISDISHQSITPISNILLYSQLLEEQEEQPKEEIAAIREQTEKLNFLVQSLVKLSRLETGTIVVSVKDESVSKLFGAVRTQFNSGAEQKQITLEIKETDISAKFDLKWTTEAVANIVDNAVKYTPKGGRVTISAECYQFFARINITDTGIGIKENDLSRIFARFYRALEVSDEPGVGIGLFLAREIIQEQKGYIKVHSQPGQGSSFSVFLPI